KLEQALHIRFLRETVVQESAPISGIELSSASLAALPADMIAELDKAALRADSKRLRELIEHIRTQDDRLANGLIELVKAYRVDKIHALTQAVKGIQQAGKDQPS